VECCPDYCSEQTRPVCFWNAFFSQTVPSKSTSGQSGHPGTLQIHSNDGPQSGCGEAATRSDENVNMSPSAVAPALSRMSRFLDITSLISIPPNL